MSDSETAACPICLRDALVIERCTSPFNGKNFGRYACRPCSFEFWEPRSLEHSSYSGEEFPAYAVMHHGQYRLPPWTALFLIGIGAERGRLLDIGCGDGSFLKKASDLGFSVTGIDIDSKSVSIAQTLRGISDVHAVGLSEAMSAGVIKPKTFDVVTFFEVLEHQPDPMNFLAQVRKLLKPGGRIFGSVPNRHAIFQNTRYWHRFYSEEIFPPHHFLWFDRASVSEILSRAGWRGIRTAYSHHLDLDGLASAAQALIFGQSAEKLKNRIKRRAYRTPAQGEPPDRHTNFLLVSLAKRAFNSAFYLPGVLLSPWFNGVGQGVFFEAVAPRDEELT